MELGKSKSVILERKKNGLVFECQQTLRCMENAGKRYDEVKNFVMINITKLVWK